MNAHDLVTGLAAAISVLFGAGGIGAIYLAVKKGPAERDRIVVSEALDVATARRAEIDHLVERVDSLLAEGTALREELDALRRKYATAEADRDRLAREVARLRAERDDLRKQLGQLGHRPASA